MSLQFSTEELIKEIENSVSEFKRSKVEYDEERVKEQVGLFPFLSTATPRTSDTLALGLSMQWLEPPIAISTSNLL